MDAVNLQQYTRDDEAMKPIHETDSGYEGSESLLEHRDPFHRLYGVQLPFYFIIMALLTLPLYDWSRHWWISGAPLLTMALLSGRLGSLSKSPVLLLLAVGFVNVTYALFSTSWLFHRFYIIAAYPIAAVIAVLSSRRLRKQLRGVLRKILRSLDIVDDKIAFFDLPGLNIDDGDVPVLLVIRGITFTLSTMTLEVHGIEVGIKINEDLDIAIQTDSFAWRIMREIRIGEVYASIHGPFTDTNKQSPDRQQDNTTASQKLTDNRQPKQTDNLDKVSSVGDQDGLARTAYQARLEQIRNTDIINQARSEIMRDDRDDNSVRAAIGARTQANRAVPNPPESEIKSSALVAMIPGWVKTVFQRFPVFLRLFLNPVSYNHPVHFSAIIMTGAGSYINQILETQFFKYYPEENKEIRKLQKHVMDYLGNGRFSVVLPDILGFASVPFLTEYDIITHVKTPSVLMYKITVNSDGVIADDGDEIAEVTGLANTATIPSCLLPNHEYLLPPVPTDPEEPDQVMIKMAVLGSLPGKFAPEMIEFAITLLKASQVLTLHKQANSMSEEVHSPVDFGRSVGKATLEQTKKKLVEAHVDDTWLHKLILKAFVALRKAKGDAGYQFDIPISLEELRQNQTFVRRSSTSTVASRKSSLSEPPTPLSNTPGMIVH